MKGVYMSPLVESSRFPGLRKPPEPNQTPVLTTKSVLEGLVSRMSVGVVLK